MRLFAKKKYAVANVVHDSEILISLYGRRFFSCKIAKYSNRGWTHNDLEHLAVIITPVH